MVKSRAEIQKAYRQRLKEKNNNEYLSKERERRRRTYVENQLLSEEKRVERNKKNREYLRLYRQRKRELVQQNNRNQEDVVESSGYESAHVEPQNRLNVRLNFHNRANGPKMRVAKELRKTKQELKALKETHENLKRKYRSTMRSIQRKNKKTDKQEDTPKSKAKRLVEKLNLTREQSTSVRKELVFANAICDEIRSAAHKAPVKAKKILQNLVAGNVLKKYRLLQKFGEKTGMSRNKLSKVRSKSVNIGSLTRIRETTKMRQKVIEFLERDENSRNMPGKGDFTKSETGEKKQTRVLTDYLSSLYHKFMSENPDAKLSFTSFTRIRPARIRLTSMITRDTCLCTKHQNMSLTLKSLKSVNIECSINGEKMIDQKERLIQEAEKALSSDIAVGQWKRVETEVKGQKKSVMKVVNITMKPDEFMSHLKTQIEDFDQHVIRIKTQYSEMKNLKENLPDNHCIIHMDFSENYSCKSVQEIQSAYWNQTAVTLHPVVVYYRKDGSDKIQHKSYVFISDEMGHNANTVLAITDKLVPTIKDLIPGVTWVHYWTDSPTSQYRNKVIFNFIANHKDIHGIHARWNYWEEGHGKGPCDGLGGRVKRMADEAVNSGKVGIQDPFDFYAWSQSSNCSMKNVSFVFVSSEECEKKAVETGKLHLKPITGTMKIHSVLGKGNNSVSVRNTSCYCKICVSDDSETCGTWRDETLVQKSSKPTNTDKISNIQVETVKHISVAKPNIDPKETYHVDDYVAASYLGHWYIGKIMNCDDEDNTFEITFLQKRKRMFQWPTRPDEIWVNYEDILCKVSTPLASGKSKRMLVLRDGDFERVEQVFDQVN